MRAPDLLKTSVAVGNFAVYLCCTVSAPTVQTVAMHQRLQALDSLMPCHVLSAMLLHSGERHCVTFVHAHGLTTVLSSC